MFFKCYHRSITPGQGVPTFFKWSSVLWMACNLSVVACTNNSITQRATIIPFLHSLSLSTRFFLAARVEWVWCNGRDRMNPPRMLIWSLNTCIVLSSSFFWDIFTYNGNKAKKQQQVCTLTESLEIFIVMEIMCFLYNPKVAFNTSKNLELFNRDANK